MKADSDIKKISPIGYFPTFPTFVGIGCPRFNGINRRAGLLFFFVSWCLGGCFRRGSTGQAKPGDGGEDFVAGFDRAHDGAADFALAGAARPVGDMNVLCS